MASLRPLVGLGVLFCCAPSLAQTVFYRIAGPSNGSRFGFTVDGAGDTDGDGFEDFLAGAPSGGPAPAGGVFLLSGFTGAPLLFLEGSSDASGWDQLGWSVSGIGDVSGDGVPDFAATANGWSDRAPDVRVYDGSTGALLFRRPGLGWSVSAAGDVDADGFPDLVAGGGAPGSLQFGKAQLLSGRGGGVILTWTSPDPTDLLGWSVSGVGDVDGDGRGDVLLGAPWEDTPAVDAGSARLYAGLDGSLLQAFAGTSPSEQLGWSVGGGGDTDGGGVPDLLLGVPFDPSFPAGGRVALVSGESPTTMRWFAGAAPGDAFGTAVADAGDLDGDGLADFVVGAPGVDAQGIDAGRAYAFSGASGTVLWTLDGPGPLDSLGTGVAGAGDVNGDGVRDLIAGAGAPTGTGLAVIYSGFCFSTPPWITHQPQDVNACLGTAVTLSVTASGPPPIHYQWRKDGVPLPGENDNALTIVGAVFEDQGTYDVVVAGCAGSVTSAPAVLTITPIPPPTITQQPEDVAVCAGNPVTFLVGATGQGPLRYQWRKDGEPIPDAVTSQYSIFDVSPGDAGSYDAVVMTCGGMSVSDPAVLAVNTGVPPPEITQPPQNVTTCVGDPFELQVDVKGAPPITVRWRRNGVFLPGGTGLVYRVPSASFADAGTYDAVATNCVGTATSPSATVRVGAWTSYGAGTPGTGCTPVLISSCPLLATTASIVILGGMGGAPGTVVLGTSAASIPLLGGTLLLQPILASLPVTIGGIPGIPCTGTGTATLPLPGTPSLQGLDVFLQGLVVDPGAPGGVAMTQGVQWTIG